MRIHLVNPSDVSFGVAVITPRWLYVLAAATPAEYGDPSLVDETLEQFDLSTVSSGDIVGIGIHTANAHRGYQIGREARARGAWVVYGGIHSTLYPDEAREHGAAHAVVKGDGDLVWGNVIADCAAGAPRGLYEGGRVAGRSFFGARWDLLPKDVQDAIAYAEERTKGYTNYLLNLAVAYGGRQEIVDAIRDVVRDAKAGKVNPDDIDESFFSRRLYTADLPDPDLVLRTSGEERISNFLLWQLAYSELYFVDVFWPGFRKIDFLRAIRSFQMRQRRFGA